MAIKYRMYQDNRKNSKNKGAWYARAYSPDLVGMKELATRINNTCTVTESDVLAVITALVVEMNYALLSGGEEHQGFQRPEAHQSSACYLHASR